MAGSVPLRCRRRSVAQRVPVQGEGAVGRRARGPSRTRVSPSRQASPGGGAANTSTRPSNPRTGVGIDVGPAALVVEADVAADDREGEGPARLGHPVDALGELPHDLGMFGVAEVQAVDDGHRRRPHAGQVGHALGQRERRAGPGIERAVAGIGVGGHRHPARGVGQAGTGQAQERGVTARADHGVQEELVVVLAEDPARRAQQGQQVGGAVVAAGRAGRPATATGAWRGRS